MSDRFEWIPGERKVKARGVSFSWTQPTSGELLPVRRAIERAALIFETLQGARKSFESGAASYVNAYEEVGRIVDETLKAARGIVDACRALDQWITPWPSQAFLADGDGFLRFAREWVAVAISVEQEVPAPAPVGSDPFPAPPTFAPPAAAVAEAPKPKDKPVRIEVPVSVEVKPG